jgi:hypothetical protein
MLSNGAHPASCPVGTGGPFPGVKARQGRDADHSPHLVPRSRMSRSYISSPPKRLRGVLWDSFSYTNIMMDSIHLMRYVADRLHGVLGVGSNNEECQNTMIVL